MRQTEIAQKMLDKFKNLPDDRIGEDIYISYHWADNKLIRIYLGSKQCGPMLQYDAPRNIPGAYVINGKLHDPNQFWDVEKRVYYPNGAWTNLYSRGDFGKKYAYGGHWSGHCKNIHPRLGDAKSKDKTTEIMLDGAGNSIPLPLGIKGDITMTEMDCSGGWDIWYPTAKQALQERLTITEINKAFLPPQSKAHLLANETNMVLQTLIDVIEAYNL